MVAKEKAQKKRARLRAEARELRRSKVRFRRKIKRFIFGAIVGLGGAAIVLSMVMPDSLGSRGGGGSTIPTSSGEAIQMAIQGNEVVELGQDHPLYSTTPPTSGWRYEVPLEEMTWGAKAEPVENEAQAAYLERGGVMVQYDCPDGCPDLLQKLERVVDRYSQGVVLAPYPDMDTTIAVTAWGWMDTFEEFDDPRIDGFIRTHLDQGPRSFNEVQGGQ